MYQRLLHIPWVFIIFLMSFYWRFLFKFIFNNFAFINYQVLLINDNAICWDYVTCLNLNDITNYEIIDADSLSHVFFSSDNWNFLFFKPFLKVDESFVHRIVIVATKGNQDDNANENRETLCPSKITIFADKTCEHRDGSAYKETQVQLITSDFIHDGFF